MRAVAATLTCLGLVVTLSGCGSSDDGSTSNDSSKSSDGSRPAAKTADPPMEFNAEAGVALPATALRANVAGNVVSRFTTLSGRLAYIVAPDSLSAVDVISGEQKWKVTFDGAAADPNGQNGPFVDNTGPRPPLVSADGDVVVAAVPIAEPGKGTTPGHQALSVLAVDTETGEESWSTKVKVADEVSGGDGQGAVTSVVAVTDSSVVVSYRNETAMTAAIDPTNRQVRWERQDYEAQSVHGEVVVGVDGNVAENSSMNQATAVGLSDGNQRWVAAARSYGMRVFGAGTDLVAIDRTDYGNLKSSLLLLDPSNGTERGNSIPSGGASGTCFGECEYDQQSVLICASGGQLMAFDATGKRLWSLPDNEANRIAPDVTAVWHGAVYGNTPNGPVVLDAKTGADRSTEPRIAPSWVSEYAGIGVDDQGAPTAYPVLR